MPSEIADTTARGIALAASSLAEALLLEMVLRRLLSPQDAKDLMERLILEHAEKKMPDQASRTHMMVAADWLEGVQERLAPKLAGRGL